jgi:hypothetical protein
MFFYLLCIVFHKLEFMPLFYHSTSGTRRVNLVTNPVISRAWGKDREVFTTSGTYPWSYVTQIYHNGQLDWRYGLFTMCKVDGNVLLIVVCPFVKKNWNFEILWKFRNFELLIFFEIFEYWWIAVQSANVNLPKYRTPRDGHWTNQMTVKLSINNIKNTAFLFSRYKLYIDLDMYIDLWLRPRSIYIS